ncbi:heavy metal sensor histidine kinase [Pseudomonas gingeri]|uniref:heavy metal sensor histidine kinase n=1 Tax=Pseudomonas gingeri TaxID=117681 RepID=UPI0015A20F95|nr:heavy metal sensor histidine kinase [Pseudomonas gingeri]NVZ66033.1 heavy metal sensor histidine kinase [Pseudomonas gingeri]NVZ75989.1 heavy metal sensor histidine kinase [Pseudomonas gingeri]
MNRRHYSLTLRLALVFVLLAFAVLATTGVALYRELERELIRRDDSTLVYRIDQLRNFLNDSNTLELIRTKPVLFQNMLGNRESVLMIGESGQEPLLEVNPADIDIPDLTPVTINHSLALTDVQHLPGVNGAPFSAISANIDSGKLKVTIGRLMTERTAVLASYRLSVYVLASLAAIVLALIGYVVVHRGLLPLRRLAHHAHGIGIGNLTERLDGQGAPKELLPMIDSFNTMLERLATGFAQLSQVSTDMAHELRTPINNLLGETQVAMQQNRSVEHYQQLLASNVEELERLARMLDNMLFLARTDPGSARDQRQELNAADELERVADYFEGLAADADISIRAEGEGLIWAEPMLLRRALANLCANAIKYGAADSELLIQAVPSADGIKLRVRNHGPTIPAEHLPRLFERFYRVDQSRERSAQSNGLGLSIVATIMQLHSGRYSVTSENGVTCFELFFPRRE